MSSTTTLPPRCAITVVQPSCPIPTGQSCGIISENVGAGKTDGGDDLSLSWSPVSGAIEYEVQRCQGASCESVFVNPDTGAIFTGKKAYIFEDLKDSTLDSTKFNLRARVSSSSTCTPVANAGWSSNCKIGTKFDCDRTSADAADTDTIGACTIRLKPHIEDKNDGNEVLTLYSNDHPQWASSVVAEDRLSNPDDCDDLRISNTYDIRTSPDKIKIRTDVNDKKASHNFAAGIDFSTSSGCLYSTAAGAGNYQTNEPNIPVYPVGACQSSENFFGIKDSNADKNDWMEVYVDLEYCGDNEVKCGEQCDPPGSSCGPGTSCDWDFWVNGKNDCGSETIFIAKSW